MVKSGNDRLLILLLTVLVSLGSLTCATMRATEAAAKPLAGHWEYSIEYQNQGTRSEARSHYINYNGQRIPDVFSLVCYKAQAYVFSSRSQLWGDDGYCPVKEMVLPIGPDVFTASDDLRGYYLSRQRKGKTPESWLYAERGELALFINPDRLDEIIALFEMTAFSRVSPGVVPGIKLP